MQKERGVYFLAPALQQTDDILLKGQLEQTKALHRPKSTHTHTQSVSPSLTHTKAAIEFVHNNALNLHLAPPNFLS